MIKFAATGKNGRPLLGLGVTLENVKLLMEGKPLVVNGELLELPMDVMIMYGVSEQALMTELQEAGVKFPEAKVSPDGSDSHDT
jgi:hypothetical protein